MVPYGVGRGVAVPGEGADAEVFVQADFFIHGLEEFQLFQTFGRVGGEACGDAFRGEDTAFFGDSAHAFDGVDVFVDGRDAEGDVFRRLFHVRLKGFPEGDEALNHLAVRRGMGHELDFCSDEFQGFPPGEVVGRRRLHGVDASLVLDVLRQQADGFRVLRPDGAGLEARPEVFPGFPPDEESAAGFGAGAGEAAAGQFVVRQAGFPDVNGRRQLIGLVILHVLLVVQEARPLGVMGGVFFVHVGGDVFCAGALGEVEAVAPGDDFQPAVFPLPGVDGGSVRAVVSDQGIDHAFFAGVDFDLWDFRGEVQLVHGDHAKPGSGVGIPCGAVGEDALHGGGGLRQGDCFGMPVDLLGNGTLLAFVPGGDVRFFLLCVFLLPFPDL